MPEGGDGAETQHHLRNGAAGEREQPAEDHQHRDHHPHAEVLCRHGHPGHASRHQERRTGHWNHR